MAFFLRLLNLHCTCPNNSNSDKLSLSINGIQVKQIAQMSYDDLYHFKNTPLIPIRKDLDIKLWTKDWLKPKIELGQLQIPKQQASQLKMEAWLGKKQNHYRLLYEITFNQSQPVLNLIKLESIQSVGIWGWDKISLIVNAKLALNARKLKQGQSVMLAKRYNMGKIDNVQILLNRHDVMRKEKIGEIVLRPKYRSLGVREETFDNYGCLYELKYEIVQFSL